MESNLRINIFTINQTPYEKALGLMRELRESYIIEGLQNHARGLVTPKAQEDELIKVNKPKMKKTLSWEDLKEGGGGDSSTNNSGNSSESEEPYLKKFKITSPKNTEAQTNRAN